MTIVERSFKLRSAQNNTLLSVVSNYALLRNNTLLSVVSNYALLRSNRFPKQIKIS
jgi:hypothetical protein